MAVPGHADEMEASFVKTATGWRYRMFTEHASEGKERVILVGYAAEAGGDCRDVVATVEQWKQYAVAEERVGALVPWETGATEVLVKYALEQYVDVEASEQGEVEVTYSEFDSRGALTLGDIRANSEWISGGWICLETWLEKLGTPAVEARN